MGGWDSSSRWTAMSMTRLRRELAAQEFLSVPEAAKVLRMDVRTIRRMAERDQAVGVKFRASPASPGRWRIRTSWLREQVTGRQGDDGRAA